MSLNDMDVVEYKLAEITKRLDEDGKRLGRIEAFINAYTKEFERWSFARVWINSAPKPKQKCEECVHGFMVRGLLCVYCRAHPRMSGVRPWCIGQKDMYLAVDAASMHNPDGDCEKWEARC